MIIDTLAAAPDLTDAAATTYHMAQTTTIGGNSGNAPSLDVRFSDGVEKIIRVISVALAVAWALYFIWLVGKPGGARQAVQKMGGVVGIIAALVAIVGGLDINTTMDVIDSLLSIGWAVMNTIKDAFS